MQFELEGDPEHPYISVVTTADSPVDFPDNSKYPSLPTTYIEDFGKVYPRTVVDELGLNLKALPKAFLTSDLRIPLNDSLEAKELYVYHPLNDTNFSQYPPLLGLDRDKDLNSEELNRRILAMEDALQGVTKPERID